MNIEITEVNEILDALKKTDSVEHAIYTINDFIEALKVLSYPLTIKTLKEQLEDYIIEEGYCPKCFFRMNELNEMHFQGFDEPREYQGAIVYEPCGAMVCEECGWEV